MKMLRNMAIVALVCYSASAMAEQRWFEVFAKMNEVTNAQLDSFMQAVDRNSWNTSAQELLQDIKDVKKALQGAERTVAAMPILAGATAEKLALLKHNAAVGLDGLGKQFDYLNSQKGINGLAALSNAADRELYTAINNELGR